MTVGTTDDVGHTRPRPFPTSTELLRPQWQAQQTDTLDFDVKPTDQRISVFYRHWRQESRRLGTAAGFRTAVGVYE